MFLLSISGCVAVSFLCSLPSWNTSLFFGNYLMIFQSAEQCNSSLISRKPKLKFVSEVSENGSRNEIVIDSNKKDQTVLQVENSEIKKRKPRYI